MWSSKGASKLDRLRIVLDQPVAKHSTDDNPLLFEYKHEPLATPAEFAWRMLTFTLFASGIVGVTLSVGIFGYRYIVGLNWIDSLLNASMILGGMGQVDPITTTWGKLFASFYALFSGLIFVVSFSVIISPIMHRILHKFHMEEAQRGDDG